MFIVTDVKYKFLYILYLEEISVHSDEKTNAIHII